jgi:hypothetical protein
MKNNLSRLIYFIAITLGSVLGSWLPTLFGASFLSMWSLIGGGIGAFLFLYLAYKFITWQQ